MKKHLISIFILSLVLFTACSAQNSLENSSPSAIDIPDSPHTGVISQTDIETISESRSEAEESHENSTETVSVSDRDEKSQLNNDPETVTPQDKNNISGSENPKGTLPSQSLGNDSSDVSSNPTETTTPQTKPAESKQEKTESTTVSSVAYAGKNDTDAVAQKVLEYINGYRSSPATMLSGLTKYAKYRSRQIVSNFAHDTADQRAAATALRYGEYVDPTVFGGSGQPYYRANAREAIAKAGYVGTVDEVALKLANLVKNSTNHWKYIGDSSYCYIAVGVTYESDMWYCVVTVAAENTDEY